MRLYACPFCGYTVKIWQQKTKYVENTKHCEKNWIKYAHINKINILLLAEMCRCVRVYYTYLFVYLTVSQTSANCRISKLGKQISSHTHAYTCLRMLFSMNFCFCMPGFRFRCKPSVAYKRGGQNKNTHTHTHTLACVCECASVSLCLCLRFELNASRA